LKEETKIFYTALDRGLIEVLTILWKVLQMPSWVLNSLKKNPIF